MGALRVSPSFGHGRERLYVGLPDGSLVAWYDRDTGRVSLLVETRADEVLAALGPYLAGPVSVGPPPVPGPAELAGLALHPDDDLAPNRPGEALHAALDRNPPRSRPFGFPGADPRRAELAAQERVGGELDRLEAAGWRVLHSVPLPGDDRIHHLAIGPAGVLAVRTLPAPRQRVRIGDPDVTVGRGRSAPQLRWARRAAERASLALAAAVRPVLAVVGAARLAVEQPPPPGVRILRDDEVPALGRLGGVLKPADVEALHAVARDRRTWARA
ncbi:nuclease-related domain-containing protein [Streptomyces sp. NPDC050504]|uniref:nuclease-related domain-containing protein n=1 Tax=Streptomyces sp. NPDC050504 TaxID=3365618 RepID=UPI00379D4C68